MDIKNQIIYWLNSAERDVSTAERLFSSGDYHWCLFIAHLVLEKAVKAYYCHIIQDTPPRIHDLVKLANLAKLELSEEQTLFYNRVGDLISKRAIPTKNLGFIRLQRLILPKKILLMSKVNSNG